MLELLAQGPIFLVCLAFLLGVVVIIHELGHYYVGRFYGAAVESFSVGFGSPIFERKDKNGTRWRVNWIPLGGFVKFVGESQMPSDVGKVEDGPIGKPYPQLGVGARSLVSIAGPIANFVLAIGLFALIFGFNGVPDESVDANRVTIVDVAEGQPAQQAGLMSNDIIVSVNGKSVQSANDVQLEVLYATGEVVRLLVDRDDQQIELFVTPERVTRDNGLGQQVPQGTIGVRLSSVVELRSVGPIEAIGLGSERTLEVLGLTTKMLGRIVTGREPVNSLSGPVAIGDAGRRIFNLTIGNSEVPFWTGVSVFFWNMMGIVAAISIGIGFFNLLPLPVLDGGHLVFNAYEFVTGKTMPEKVQEIALMAGLSLLLTMFVFITWGDILETGLFNGSAG